jgi:hypothetical protein
MNGQAGKGDTYRPIDRQKWDENYERIFGKKDAKVTQTNKSGNSKTSK